MIILIAAGVMIGATLAQHLGLTEAIAKIVSKIASCPMCCSFWLCLAALALIYKVPIHHSLLLSIIAAYASHWFVIVLFVLQEKYNKLWQKRMTKRK